MSETGTPNREVGESPGFSRGEKVNKYIVDITTGTILSPDRLYLVDFETDAANFLSDSEISAYAEEHGTLVDVEYGTEPNQTLQVSFVYDPDAHTYDIQAFDESLGSLVADYPGMSIVTGTNAGEYDRSISQGWPTEKQLRKGLEDMLKALGVRYKEIEFSTPDFETDARTPHD